MYLSGKVRSTEARSCRKEPGRVCPTSLPRQSWSSNTYSLRKSSIQEGSRKTRGLLHSRSIICQESMTTSGCHFQGIHGSVDGLEGPQALNLQHVVRLALFRSLSIPANTTCRTGRFNMQAHYQIGKRQPHSLDLIWHAYLRLYVSLLRTVT
jgi:hypothetical protein